MTVVSEKAVSVSVAGTRTRYYHLKSIFNVCKVYLGIINNEKIR